MGHSVEYLIELDPAAAREWVSQFDGFWLESETASDLISGEFHLWENLDVVVYVGPLCRLTVPQIKYSWLITGNSKVTALVERLDRMLVNALPDVCILRLDELLVDEWEAQAGRPWHQMPPAIAPFHAWLCASGHDPRHYYLLGSHPENE